MQINYICTQWKLRNADISFTLKLQVEMQFMNKSSMTFRIQHCVKQIAYGGGAPANKPVKADLFNAI